MARAKARSDKGLRILPNSGNRWYETARMRAPWETAMKDISDKKLLKTGLIGSGVIAICCFTPVLVLTMGAVGLSALVGWWLDLLLFPALGLFLLMAGYGFYRLRQRQAEDA